MNIKVIASGAASFVAKRMLGPFWMRRRWLAKTQWLTGSEIESVQLELLKILVRHCYNSVPYYKRLMDERGIKHDDIKSLQDIKLFPVLNKKEVLEAGYSIVSDRYPKFLVRAAYTGGTTGTPLKLYRDLFSIANEHAFVRRQWDWAGIGLGDRCAYLTGRVIAGPDKVTGLYAYDPIMKELIFSTYHLSAGRAQEYAEVMRRYRVKAVVGYPSAVHLLAKVCINRNVKLKLDAVLTSSESISDSMRATISRAFECEVFDFYGSAERVCYIHTCECGTYHIIPEYGFAELIPVNQTGDGRCKIVATGFWNLSMPLIRYDTGDVVIRTDCSCLCGRQYPAVKCISGRTGDVIRTPSGRELGPAILTHLLYGVDHIIESQIVQDSSDHIIIKYVPSSQFSEGDLQTLKSLIVMHLPGELKVDFKQVAVVEKTASGKVRSIISLIT